MMYGIGEVSKMFALPVSTLRYYDNEGLFPNLQRNAGVRVFGEQELEQLRVIECLKRSGLEIKDIKRFMELCKEGSKILKIVKRSLSNKNLK
ncbi:MerR-like DNA binding protein [Breznakia blatticola]|uniref:MerR-like DNA binding protein n=1 Tax=Breznakia blatticola TaxID=1754012 RepID=A0A4R7ZSR8_9FIRM|nr:MerR family transcriptional regulator [Breznakia blatticola]TDW21029.1 MerR-like DNA binding protein [Breznakia blatticola]